MDTMIVENEVKEALECIDQGKNFILQGGAGSGKTYSLISLIQLLIIKNKNFKIVCITYTNNAVVEIKSYIDNDDLWVSTIHEFIWNIIKKYQNEIKNILVDLINDNDEKFSTFSKPENFDNIDLSVDYFNNLYVSYDEYYSMNPDINNTVKISHNHIIIIAEKMFAKYKKLSDILKDMADFIFIDEYQDTSPYVTEILLTHLKKSNKKNIIGFFGDSMQCIYDEGVGDLDKYNLTKIIKKQNRRNPRRVIELANKLRNDDIKQTPSGDLTAPNMENGIIIEGNVKFIYGSENKLKYLKNKEIFKSWDFLNGMETKELRLTHKYNAEMAGFKKLFELYNNDLIVKLINKIDEFAEGKKLIIKDKTVNDLVLELKTESNIEQLIKKICEDGKINNLYKEYIKNKLLKDALEKIKINRESLMSYKFNDSNGKYESNSCRDKILQRLDILNEIIEYYKSNKINEILKKTCFRINEKNDKIKLKESIDYIIEEDKTIEEVFFFSENQGLLKKDELFEKYINKNGLYLWKRIKEIHFKEYRNSVNYLKKFSPICTQHSVKGSEFDNVLIVLKSNWNKYDFKTLFKDNSSNESVRLRTMKLFYVCVTRAKKNLIIYMDTNDKKIIEKANFYFGEENVVSIDSIK